MRLIKIYGGGGGSSFSLPLAADGTRGGVQIGYTASGRNYPVQLDNERMYVNVPWTDHYAWSDITSKPAYATRWPTFSEVTDKPAYATRWPTFSEVTDKPATATRWPSWSEVTGKPATARTAWGQTFWNTSSEPVSISGDMSGVGNVTTTLANGRYYQLGGVRLVYDQSNNAVKIVGSDGTSTANLYATGGLSALSAGVTNTSDIRLKKRVQDVDLTLEQIAEAPMFKFYWNDASKGRDLHVGTSAQYWEKILPQVVRIANDEMKTRSMQYDVAALASAVQGAKEVVRLKGTVNSLSTLIVKLSSKIERLENELSNLSKTK